MIKKNMYSIITRDLRNLDFVQWDRYTESKEHITLFGWIKREDKHEDFVIITYWPDKNDINYSFSWKTSSKKYSEIISRILNTDHVPCKRIEDDFNIPNVIKLKEMTNR